VTAERAEDGSVGYAIQGRNRKHKCRRRLDTAKGSTANRGACQSITVRLQLEKMIKLLSYYRRLLDAQMLKAIDTVDATGLSYDNPIIETMLALLMRDGLDAESI